MFRLNQNKQKTYPNSLKESIFGYFFRKFRVVLVCFGLLRNRSVCFGCFDIGSKHRNKLKFLVFGFTKQTETNAKQILFLFVSVRTEFHFCLFRGHPSHDRNRSLQIPLCVLSQSEPVCVNVYGAQESIPRNRFRQPMQPDGPVRKIELSYRPARLEIDSCTGSFKGPEKV